MSATKNSLTHAPYLDGDLQEYVWDKYPGRFFGWVRGERTEGEWAENAPFAATLFYKTWERGRSAVRVIWEDAEGHQYPMFMKDMDAALSTGRILPVDDGGSSIHGTWWVVKRGANYGIALAAA